MSTNNERKKRKRNNQRIIDNLNTILSEDFLKTTTNLSPQPLKVISNAELDSIANKLIDLKGEEKEIYLNKLKQRTDAIYLAQGLIFSFSKILDNYKDFNKDTLETYKQHLNHLHKKLEKINETDNPVEINNIYASLNDITNKIHMINKDQRNFWAIAGAAVGATAIWLAKTALKR